MSNLIPRSVIDILPENIYWVDVNNVVVGSNYNQAKVLGMQSPEDLIGLDMHQVSKRMNWREEITRKLIDNNKEIMLTRKGTVVEEKLFWEGEYRDMLSYKEPWIGENDEVLGVVGISVDITMRKRNEMLQLSNEEIKKRSEYLRLVAGTIGHDLRTPLLSIKTGMMGLEKNLPKLIESYQMACEAGLDVPSIPINRLQPMASVAARSSKEIDFANSYIDMVLNNLKYDTIDNSGYVEHDVVKVLNYSLDTYPYLDDEERTLLTFEPKHAFRFWGNDFYLKNVMNNLLKNAFFYIKKNNRGRISIRTDENDAFNLIYIKDTAQGAPENILAQMFQGYFTTREGGTGLGLAFSKAIMESFEGDITATSVFGEFIEFELKFPKVRLADSTATT